MLIHIFVQIVKNTKKLYYKTRLEKYIIKKTTTTKANNEKETNIFFDL